MRRPPVPSGRGRRAFDPGILMTLSPALPAVADSPFPAFCTSHDATTRRTGAAALAAALAAASSSWLHLVRYEAPTRWTHLLPPDDAAAVLDPSLHGELGASRIRHTR